MTVNGEHPDPASTAIAKTRAIVLHPALRQRSAVEDARARVDEACGLAAAIDLDVVHAEHIVVNRPRPSTLFGKGVVERFEALIEGLEADLVIVDHSLSPGQQRNLERAWKTKVIDRTGLILEIFGERARTREGMLQVELAHLTYQKSRLVRSWTHLERQRGGAGFLGGPGETQIEIDRRLIGDRITRLKKELDKVVRTRDLHRAARKRVPYPIVALVGYTNAGKSTLFNYLTESSVHAQDQLFATLDPTMRALELPSRRRVILSDTVGFVSDLPHELVAAFRATLEEVIEADVIIHVRDISHAETEDQKRDVEEVLSRMDIESSDSHPILEALNKVDLLDASARGLMNEPSTSDTAPLLVSGLTGEGTADLIAQIERIISVGRRELGVAVPVADGKTLAWLYRKGEVLAREDGEVETTVTVLLDPADADRLTANNTVRFL
ncbi:MAG: GTPase HflX [Rhodospirillaceae bacterium]|nr:GTPase HflX [Rhodospirillaceae bacterium]MBT6089339.1 GTPase HflX [Rhodospirillaceae bacterium]MBT7451738.1 GTPase HflX [Rhodospirillaceae bacterium]